MRVSIRWTAFLVVAMMTTATVAQAQWTWTPQTGRWINTKRLPKETDELQIEHARSLMLEGKHKKALQETAKFTKFYDDSDMADENQYLRGEIKLSMGKLMDASQEFQKVLVNYPETTRYDDAIARQYEIGDGLYERGQLKLKKKWTLFRKRPLRHAIEVYSMVVDNQPFTAAAAEAQYKIGLCHYTREEYLEAAFEYRRVLEDYAGSDWVDEASYSLAQCYYDGALDAEYDQTPSMLAISAIDSFHQRYPSDDRNEDLSARRVEMRERIAEQRFQTAKFYEKRRNFDSARIYYGIVVEEFGDTRFAEEAKQWLSDHPQPETEAQKEIRLVREAS